MPPRFRCQASPKNTSSAEVNEEARSDPTGDATRFGALQHLRLSAMICDRVTRPFWTLGMRVNRNPGASGKVLATGSTVTAESSAKRSLCTTRAGRGSPRSTLQRNGDDVATLQTVHPLTSATSRQASSCECLQNFALTDQCGLTSALLAEVRGACVDRPELGRSQSRRSQLVASTLYALGVRSGFRHRLHVARWRRPPPNIQVQAWLAPVYEGPRPAEDGRRAVRRADLRRLTQVALQRLPLARSHFETAARLPNDTRRACAAWTHCISRSAYQAFTLCTRIVGSPRRQGRMGAAAGAIGLFNLCVHRNLVRLFDEFYGKT